VTRLAFLRPLPTLTDLVADHQRVEELSEDATRTLFYQVTALLPVLAARLAVRPGAPDRLLTATEAASRLGVSPAALYKRARAGKYPFIVRTPGVRELRFSEATLGLWIRQQQRRGPV
jgi:predicted DNA-binding transcriptional regulator AlpA